MERPEQSSEQRPDSGRMPTRRQVVAVGLGAFVVAALPLRGRSAPRLVRRSAPCMGTVAELGVVHRDEAYAHAAMDAALAELRWVERAMTRFRDDSEVGRVNLSAGRGAVPVSDETAHVVLEGLRWAEVSEGAFDPSVGRAVALWDVGNRTRPPSEDEVRELAGRNFFRSVEVGRHRGGSVVRLQDPDAALDMGGIAKGYGVDRAVAALRRWGIDRGLVNVGGDLFALGTAPDHGPWRVGVRDAHDPRGLGQTLEVEEGAVATSGDYEEFFEHDGARYHHLLDPGTGAPRQAADRSVTVLAPDCMSADAAATALFGVDLPARDRILRRMGGRIQPV
jgi:FAD:protein FMN transferase